MSILADGRSAFLALRPQIHFSLPGHPFPILAKVGAAPILPRTEAPRSAAAPAFVDKGAFAHGRFRTDAAGGPSPARLAAARSEEHTSELQSLMRISYAVFCLKKKKKTRLLEKVVITCTQPHDNEHHTK